MVFRWRFGIDGTARAVLGSLPLDLRANEVICIAGMLHKADLLVDSDGEILAHQSPFKTKLTCARDRFAWCSVPRLQIFILCTLFVLRSAQRR